VNLLDDDIMAEEMRKLLKEANLPINAKNTKLVAALIADHYGVEEFKKEIYEQIGEPKTFNNLSLYDSKVLKVLIK
jgi:hypothetical protein